MSKARSVSGVWRWVRAVVIVAVLVVLMLWLGGVFRSGQIEPGRVAAPTVPAAGPKAVVERVSVPLVESFEGAVLSARTTFLSARVAAPILALAPRVGDSVEKDASYGELETSQLAAQLAVAEAALDAARRSLDAAETRQKLAREGRTAATAELELARAEHERVIQLVQTGSATASERDISLARLRKAETADVEAVTAIELGERGVAEAQAQVVVREKELELARTNLGYARLVSNVSGRVVRRVLEPGSMATPGQPILEIYDPKDLRLEVPVRESLVPRLARDRDYRVSLPSLGVEQAARIVEIVPSAEAGSRTVRVRFALPELERLFPGMSGSVALEVGRREVLVMPRAAVMRAGQLAFVHVVDGQQASRRWVRLGLPLDADRIEILDGLEAGAEVKLREQASSDER
jgi:multidrug efflux pump subunit AcrA (membrane-fusion protein)